MPTNFLATRHLSQVCKEEVKKYIKGKKSQEKKSEDGKKKKKKKSKVVFYFVTRNICEGEKNWYIKSRASPAPPPFPPSYLL